MWALMDRQLQIRTLKGTSSSENEKNSGIQHFLQEPAPCSPPPSNVSSRGAAHGTQIEWNVSKAEVLNSGEAEENTLIVIYQLMGLLHVQCVFFLMKFCEIIL
jgi:hypothetical protein